MVGLGVERAPGTCLKEAGEGPTGWEAKREECSWLCASRKVPPPLPVTLPAPPLTRFNGRDHLPPDAVLQGIQVLADVDEHPGLDGLWLHGAEEAGKGGKAWWAGLGPCILGLTGSAGHGRQDSFPGHPTHDKPGLGSDGR